MRACVNSVRRLISFRSILYSRYCILDTVLTIELRRSRDSGRRLATVFAQAGLPSSASIRYSVADSHPELKGCRVGVEGSCLFVPFPEEVCSSMVEIRASPETGNELMDRR